MKIILKIFIVIVIIGCNNDDDKKIRTCETHDLGITEESKNPFPEVADTGWGYEDWKWTILDGNILRIKTEQVDFGQIVFQTEYYYFSIDRENNCLSFIIAKFRGGSDIDISDEPDYGEVIFPESSDYTLTLQYWEENNKFIGKLTPNDLNPILEGDKRNFWVELTDENHEPQTEWEEYLGL